MIRLLHHKELDKRAWDDCVRQSPEAQIFHYSWYLDTCDPNWCALVENDYTSVFPLSFRVKFGIMYVYQPFFTRHGGLLSITPTTSEHRLEFLKAIPKQFRYMDICLHESHKESPPGTDVFERHYQKLDLSKGYEQLIQGYSSNHKRSLRKAEKAGYSIQPDFNPDTVVEQFRLLKKDAIEAFDDGDYKTLKQLMKKVSAHSGSRCDAVINTEGIVMAAGFFMQEKNRIIYLKGFSSPEGRENGAMHFLFDRLIRSQAGNPVILDFGGSDVENVSRFYKGFGATDCLYLRLRQNRLPHLLRWLKK